MRYSTARPNKEMIELERGSIASLIKRIERETTEDDRCGGVLFVGGQSPADLMIRQAQAAIRFDRLPSYWSHNALVLSWPDGAGVDEIVGAEVALPSFENPLFVPERNGVTLFRLAKYADARRYPNIGFATLAALDQPPAEDEKAADGRPSRLDKSKLVRAALEPHRERLRYRLWDWLGAWSSFVMTGPSVDSPLVQGIPHPGAAFCEYVYEAAGLDITPGASEPNACPELLWATLRYWYRAVGAEKIGKLHSWYRLRDAKAPTREPQGWKGLARELKAMTREAAERQARTRRKPRTKRKTRTKRKATKRRTT